MDIKPNRSYLFVAMLAIILLVAGGFVLYNNSRQKGLANAPKNAQPIRQPSQPPIQTEFTKGQVISFKNQVLVVKDASNQEKQLKVASNTSIIKQKWFDAGSMGTEPAEVKAGDNVSIQTLKNNKGETEAISVVILTDKPKTFETASPSGEKK